MVLDFRWRKKLEAVLQANVVVIIWSPKQIDVEVFRGVRIGVIAPLPRKASSPSSRVGRC